MKQILDPRKRCARMVETMKREYLQIIGIDKGEESQFNNRPDLQENHRRKLSYIKERKKQTQEHQNIWYSPPKLSKQTIPNKTNFPMAFF